MNVLNLDKDGNNLSTRVYKDEKGKYSIAISKKVGEEYQNKYFPVEFLKGVELENKEEIIIKHAFLTWFDWEFDGKTGTKFIIKITAFDKVDSGEVKLKPTNVDTWGSAKSIELNESDELPFY
ncbi:MAG: hypothetical protein J6S67_10640 [Methanobrevibacter sp.]|nr:hypothetical protein [Methanobrevibacter sp.]